jgi:hypothetical protein
MQYPTLLELPWKLKALRRRKTFSLLFRFFRSPEINPAQQDFQSFPTVKVCHLEKLLTGKEKADRKICCRRQRKTSLKKQKSLAKNLARLFYKGG